MAIAILFFKLALKPDRGQTRFLPILEIFFSEVHVARLEEYLMVEEGKSVGAGTSHRRRSSTGPTL